MFILMGCTSYRKLESVERKMARFEPKRSKNIHVPTVGVIEAKRRSRAPASSPKAEESQESLKYSSKKLYFLALYRQYGEFARYIGSRSLPDIAVCPAFHSSLLDYRSADRRGGRLVYRPDFDRAKLADAGYRSLYPELSLVLGDGRSVADRIAAGAVGDGASLVEEAVFVHAGNIYGELDQLCEHGNSEHYYIYQNIASQKQDWTPEVLFKTLPFANMLILKSLGASSRPHSGRVPASVGSDPDVYSQALMARFGAIGMEDYLRMVTKSH